MKTVTPKRLFALLIVVGLTSMAGPVTAQQTVTSKEALSEQGLESIKELLVTLCQALASVDHMLDRQEALTLEQVNQGGMDRPEKKEMILQHLAIYDALLAERNKIAENLRRIKVKADTLGLAPEENCRAEHRESGL